MARVLITHGYSLSAIDWFCGEGRMPRHHLWGADALRAAGHEVELGAFGPPSRVLRHLSWRTRNRLGELAQEAGIVGRARSGAAPIVVSGEAGIIRGLAYLRRARAWRTPLIGILHQVPEPSAVERAWVRGLDVALCLSSAHRDALVERFGRDPATTLTVAWGPALDFAGYAPADAGDSLVVSAGKTDRDLLTLTRAVRDLGARARVYAIAGEPTAEAPGIELVGSGADGPIGHEAVLADLRFAAVVAIPLLANPRRLLGLSELNDALALGKPVVITRTPLLDLDVERIGCGIAVEPGDEAGWRDALAQLLGDPERARAMGAAGRRFAEREWNYDRFSAELTAAVAAATGGRAPVPWRA